MSTDRTWEKASVHDGSGQSEAWFTAPGRVQANVFCQKPFRRDPDGRWHDRESFASRTRNSRQRPGHAGDRIHDFFCQTEKPAVRNGNQGGLDLRRRFEVEIRKMNLRSKTGTERGIIFFESQELRRKMTDSNSATVF